MPWRGAALFLALLLLAGAFAFPQVPSPPASDALHLAVSAGKLSDVLELLKSGSDVNARNSLGSTPLLEAVWAGNVEIAQVLIQHGAAVDAQRSVTDGVSGATPLQYAVLLSHSELVKILLDAGARVDIRNKKGETPLHLAAGRGSSVIVQQLIDAHADVSALDQDENTPLDDAVLHGQLSTLAVLLKHGADPARPHPRDGRQPLHEACVLGFAQLLQPLVDAGANPNARDRFGQTPLDIALAYKNGSVVAALLKFGLTLKESQAAADRAMEAATFRGQTEIVRLLVENGFDVNRPTPSGSTYLNDAALKGETKVAQFLLDHGAALEKPGPGGDAPLHDAALGGNADLIALLLDRGANIDIRDRESNATPLMLAASLGRAEAVALLIRRGANPALRDKSGHTALDRARQTESKETVRLLQNYPKR